MLEDLMAIHSEVILQTPKDIKRSINKKVNWKTQALCLLGNRGVGKTTLMCQKLVEEYDDVSEAIYISADNIHVLSKGLFSIANEYFKYGGEALFIDEVHKYPNWSLEIKNIIDTYKNKRLVFSASSLLDLNKSKYDLSRRVVYHELKGLSFREYLNFVDVAELPVYSLEEIIRDHVKIAKSFKSLTILKHFKNYLKHGYYPYFLEGVDDYLLKTSNVIEKVIHEDIAVVYNLKLPTLYVLKKILWLVATSKGLQPNIEKISKNLQVSRDIVYKSFEYLEHSGLLNSIFHHAKGMKLIRKPAKSYLDNTNLLYAINGSLKYNHDIGLIRETFFANQVGHVHGLNLAEKGDFVVDGNMTIEVGGESKTDHQIKEVENAYLAIDGIEIGFGKRIPLYLFGFMY